MSFSPDGRKTQALEVMPQAPLGVNSFKPVGVDFVDRVDAETAAQAAKNVGAEFLKNVAAEADAEKAEKSAESPASAEAASVEEVKKMLSGGERITTEVDARLGEIGALAAGGGVSPETVAQAEALREEHEAAQKELDALTKQISEIEGGNLAANDATFEASSEEPDRMEVLNAQLDEAYKNEDHSEIDRIQAEMLALHEANGPVQHASETVERAHASIESLNTQLDAAYASNDEEAIDRIQKVMLQEYENVPIQRATSQMAAEVKTEIASPVEEPQSEKAAEVKELGPEEIREGRRKEIIDELTKEWEAKHGPMERPMTAAEIKRLESWEAIYGRKWDSGYTRLTDAASEFYFDHRGGGKNSVPDRAEKILVERYPEYAKSPEGSSSVTAGEGSKESPQEAVTATGDDMSYTEVPNSSLNQAQEAKQVESATIRELRTNSREREALNQFKAETAAFEALKQQQATLGERIWAEGKERMATEELARATKEYSNFGGERISSAELYPDLNGLTNQEVWLRAGTRKIQAEIDSLQAEQVKHEAAKPGALRAFFSGIKSILFSKPSVTDLWKEKGQELASQAQGAKQRFTDTDAFERQTLARANRLYGNIERAQEGVRIGKSDDEARYLRETEELAQQLARAGESVARASRAVEEARMMPVDRAA